MLVKIHWFLALLMTVGTILIDGSVTLWAIPISLLLFVLYSFAFHALHIIIAFVWSLFLDPEKKIERVHPIFRWMVVETVRMVLIVGRIGVKVEGKELLPKNKDEHFLLVSNHLSRFDPMVLMVHLADWPTAYVSKESNFKIPIAGRFVHMCHYLSIDREDPRAAMATIREATEIIASGEQNVGIYPEGTRSTTGELLPFHEGVFMIPMKARCGIAVVTVENTEQIAKRFPLRSTRVKVKIVRYFSADELKGKRSGELASLVRREMEQGIIGSASYRAT